MRNLIILMSATSLAACGGGMGAQSAGSTSVTGAATPTPAGTPTPAPTSTFVTPTATKTYQAQGAVQAYKYDYTEGYVYAKDPVTQKQQDVIRTPIVDMMGNPVLDAAGQATFTTTLRVDAMGRPVFIDVPVLDAAGNPTFKLNPDSRMVLIAGQDKQLYTANAATVRDPKITVTYDPRNAQFSLQINQNGLTDNITFQDPAHRTDFSGLRKPQLGVPNLEVGDPSVWRTKGVQYLEVDSGSSASIYDASTFFYDLPNDQTHQYVTFAGFVRNHYEKPVETIVGDSLRSQTTLVARKTGYERATFVFGEQTQNGAVPTSGSATYTGGMIASMVNNPSFDTNPNAGTWFQWLSGTASVAVDFAKATVGATLTGTTLAPLFDNMTAGYPGNSLLTPATNGGITFPTQAYIPTGATFSANATGTIDLVNKGGFTGTFGSAQFSGGGLAAPVRLDIVGSSLDGAFYGPAAQELGASFRIVGGIPDQRVDIIGAFTGKK